MNAIVNFVTTIPIANIHPFEDNPYKVQDNEEMQFLCESIRENGVLSPLLVRKIGAAEEYEVISGHRRLYAAHKLGLTGLPTVITDLDRNAAAIALMDSNLHREHILPSEKAFAYKLKMEALSHQGAACGQASHKSRDAVSDTDSGSANRNELWTEQDNNFRMNISGTEYEVSTHFDTKTGRQSPFAGLLYCPDCGAKLHFCTAKSLKPNQEFYRCANYNSGRGTCKIHYIRNVVLEEIVLEAVSSLADYVRCYEPVFLYFLAMQNNAEHQINLKVFRQSIDKGEQRIRQIDKAIEELFEAYICGKITDERFIKMTASYKKEQKNLTASVENWKLELKNAQQQKVNGRNRVKVDIYFTAVGIVNIPTETEMKAAMEEIQRSRKQAITT